MIRLLPLLPPFPYRLPLLPLLPLLLRRTSLWLITLPSLNPPFTSLPPASSLRPSSARRRRSVVWVFSFRTLPKDDIFVFGFEVSKAFEEHGTGILQVSLVSYDSLRRNGWYFSVHMLLPELCQCISITSNTVYNFFFTVLKVAKSAIWYSPSFSSISLTWRNVVRKEVLSGTVLSPRSFCQRIHEVGKKNVEQQTFEYQNQ